MSLRVATAEIAGSVMSQDFLAVIEGHYSFADAWAKITEYDFIAR